MPLPKKSRALLVLILLVISACRRPLKAPTPGPLGYIDTHNHLLFEARPSCNFDAMVEIALAEMDRFDIPLALIMPPPAPRTGCDSEAYAEVANKHPERFAFLPKKNMPASRKTCRTR